MTLCACGQKTGNETFTGDGREEAAYQDCLNAIVPSAYSNVQDLKLEPGTYISIIGKEEGDSYWKKIQEGAAQAETDLNAALGYTGSDKVKVIYNAPPKSEDINEQVNILDEELARYPDAIGIASIDEDSFGVPFDLAEFNGIPIIAFDSGNIYQGIQCTVKTNNTDAARTGAYKLADEIGGEGEVILLVHDSVSQSARERAQGFLEEIASKQPGIQVVETIYLDKLTEYKRAVVEEQESARLAAAGVQPAPEDTAVEGQSPSAEGGLHLGIFSDSETIPLTDEEKVAAANAMTDEELFAYYLEKYPNLKAMFGTNSMTVQTALKALREAERSESVLLMGFDAGAEQLDAMESGEIDGLVVQNPFGIGYAAVVAAARTILEVGNEAEVDTGYTWVTRDNMDDASIKKMLYR